MDIARNDKLRAGFDDSLSNLMAVLPGADNEPGWEIQTGDEGWTVRQMLAHLASAEVSMNALIARALGAARDGQPIGDPMAAEGGKFDLDYWNRRQVEKRAERPPSALRLELTETRAHTLRELKVRTPEELATPAWHPALGVTVVESIYKVMAIHMRDHTRAIKRALREGLHGRYWADVE